MTTTETHPDLEQMVMPEVVPAQPDALTTIVALSKRLIELRDLREEKAKIVNDMDEEIMDISERLLPDLLSSVGMSKMELASGHTIQLKNDYFGNISKARADAAFAWLRENNMGGIIKEKIEVSPSYRQQLEAAEIPFTTDQSIHASTLKAFVKERVEAGTDFPRELFGVHVATRAVVK